MNKVYLPMTADLFHIGHLRAIRQCANYGLVIVGLLNDSAVKEYRGSRPIIPFEQRKEILEALLEVSQVVEQSSINPTRNIKRYKPNFVASGDGFEETELKAIKRNKCTQLDIEYCKEQSTTKIKSKLCKKI